MKSGASHSLITKKQKRRGRICHSWQKNSAQSLWWLWVGNLHHFWWWTVGEVNWLCRQVSRANKQFIYLYVFVHLYSFLCPLSSCIYLSPIQSGRMNHFESSNFFFLYLFLSFYLFQLLSIRFLSFLITPFKYLAKVMGLVVNTLTLKLLDRGFK